MLLVQAPINSREESTAKRIQCKYDESRKLRSTKKTVSGRRTCVCQIFSPRQWKFYSPHANMVRNFFVISLLVYKIFENRLASGAMEPRGWPKPLDTAGSGLNLLLCARLFSVQFRSLLCTINGSDPRHWKTGVGSLQPKSMFFMLLFWNIHLKYGSDNDTQVTQSSILRIN